mmetsp:Transcript_30471/g.86952  ORF Transcript_30471/g.86952 Transcript_30471/m.86952 type:complete len:439 (+) Transcript_30471:440-1756(+)
MRALEGVVRREGGVVLDRLRVAAALGQDLVLRDRERHHQLLGELLVQARRVLDEGQVVRFVLGEQQQDQGLVRIDDEIVSPVVQLALDGRLPQGVDPLQAAVLRPHVVEVVEHLDGLLHLRVQVGVLYLVRRPEARRQHRHAEVDAAQSGPSLVQVVAVLPELLDEVPGQREVVDHTLELRGELRAALHLELRDHALLGVLRGRGLVEQALRELVSVDLGEQVLVAEEGEELHHLGQQLLDLVVGQPLAGLLQDPIAERRHQRGEGVLADVAVDEHFESLFQRLLEQGVLREALQDDALEAVVQVQERLDEGRVPEGFGLGGHCLSLLHALVHDLVAPVGDVLPERLRDGLETVVHQREDPMHAGQVLALVVLEEVDHCGFFLQQLRLGLRQQRLDDHVLEPWLRRPVQVVRHPLLLCVHCRLGLAQVLREGVLHEPT